MSRTQRNLPKGWSRKPSGVQRERRQFMAAKDQELPVPVRGKRKPSRLPDDWSELRVSSERERMRINRWLAKQVGRPWAEALRAAQRLPTLKRSPLTRAVALELVGRHVESKTLMRGGKVMCVGSDGREREMRVAFYVHPETGLLSKVS